MFREREGESKPQIEEEMWTALVGSIAHARTMNRQQTRAILSKTHSSLYFDHAHERLMFPSSTQSAIPKRKRPVTPSEGFLWKQIRNRRASRASRREPSVAHRGRRLLIVRTFLKFNHYVRIRCVCVYVRDVKDNCGCSVRFFMRKRGPKRPLFSGRSFTTTPPPSAIILIKSTRRSEKCLTGWATFRGRWLDSCEHIRHHHHPRAVAVIVVVWIVVWIAARRRRRRRAKNKFFVTTTAATATALASFRVQQTPTSASAVCDHLRTSPPHKRTLNWMLEWLHSLWKHWNLKQRQRQRERI